jgi:hypothetical protein
MSLCFIIPVKIDTVKQEFYIHRCINSIRRIYDAPIIIALANGTSEIVTTLSNITQVLNPYFSTIGCLYLFEKNKYADYAIILHDSMVLLSEIPKPSTDVSFVYDFYEKDMDIINYNENYKRILNINDYHIMINTQKQGCFGVSMGIYHYAVEKTGILEIASKIVTKKDFCATERIFAYLCRKNHVIHSVMCGSIFSDVDPWVNKHFETMTLEEFIARGYKQCIIKSLVGRVE